MWLSPSNPMRRVLVSVLVFEAISAGLAIAGMIFVSQVDPTTASLLAGAFALLALLAAALLRRGRVGYVLGWLLQLVFVLFGFLTPMMFAVGALFAVIWVTSFVLGRKLDQRAVAGAPADRVKP